MIFISKYPRARLISNVSPLKSIHMSSIFHQRLFFLPPRSSFVRLSANRHHGGLRFRLASPGAGLHLPEPDPDEHQYQLVQVGHPLLLDVQVCGHDRSVVGRSDHAEQDCVLHGIVVCQRRSGLLPRPHAQDQDRAGGRYIT